MAVKRTCSQALPEPLTGVQTILYLPEVDSLLRGANLVALQGFLARRDLWYEAALLKKLLYKSKNQHRSSKHFQYLSEVSCCLKLLQQMQLSELLGDLHRLSSTDALQMPSSASIVMFGSANKLVVPSQQAGILVLQRLLAGCRLATHALPAVHAAAAQLLAQLSMTYFMPFCLTALSMVARVQVLVCQLLMDSMKAYNCLLPLVTVLPRQSPSLPASADLDLPHMISCSWAGGLPTLSLLPHTDPPTFAAAAQAFAALHYLHHKPVSATADHSQHATQDMSTTNEDVGQPISRDGTTASITATAVAADDMGQKGERGSAVPEEDCGLQVSRAPGSAPMGNSKAAPTSPGQQSAGCKADAVTAVATLSAADLLGGGHQSSSAIPVASPYPHDKAHVIPNVAPASQHLHKSSADVFQLASQRLYPATCYVQSVTSPTTPVSQLAAATAVEGGEDTAAVGCAESGAPQGGPLLHRVEPEATAVTPLSHTQARPTQTQTKSQAPGDLGGASVTAANELLVFEDKQVVPAGVEEELRVQYRHTLPAATLGSHAGEQPTPIASLAPPTGPPSRPPSGPSFGPQRGQHQTDRHVQSRKRPREDETWPLAPQPSMQAKSSRHRRQSSDTTDLAKRHQAQSGVSAVPGSGSVLPANAGSSVRASSKAPARNDPLEHGTALPSGAKPLGRASSKAPWPAKQRSAQPAFIQIGEDNVQDKPRTPQTQTHPSPARGHPSNSRPGLSTAAQTDQLHAISRLHQQGAAVATTPAAAASPATLITPQSVPSSIRPNATTAPAPVAAAAAATAASGVQMCVTVPDAAAQQLDTANSQRAAVRSVAPRSAAIGSSGILGSADTTAETLAAAGSAVMPSLLQGSACAAASGPRAMLPTSRSRRKGPKATSKPEEPVKACHSWQALLGPDDIDKPEAPVVALPAGRNEQTAKGFTGQQTQQPDRAPSASKTQDIMKLLLGKR